MRRQSKAEGETWLLKSYVERLRSIERSEPEDDDFLTALRDQIWVIQAIVNTGGNPAVQSIAKRLLGMVDGVNHKDGGRLARRTTTNLLSTWREEQETLHADDSRNFKWAAWSSVSASLSAIFAILLGREGLIPMIQSLTRANVKATTHGPAPTIFVEYNPSDFSIAILHVLVIGLFLLVRFTNLGTSGKKLPANSELAVVDIESTFGQFQRGWTLVWLAWLALYSWFALIWGLVHLGFHKIPASVFWAVADVFNMGSGFAFLYIFLVMDMPSVASADDPRRHEKFRMTLRFAATTLCIVLTLSILGRFDLWSLAMGGPAVLSIVVAICMAYLFGRLDSHYLEANRWMLAPFYFYVVIQVDWVYLAADGSSFRPILLTFALLLKMYLFLVINHWIHQGHIRAYLELAARTYEQIEKERLESLRRSNQA